MKNIVQTYLFKFFLIMLFCSYVPIAYSATVVLTSERNWIPTNGNTATVGVSLNGNVSQNSSITFNIISTDWPGYNLQGCNNSKSGSGVIHPYISEEELIPN